MTLSNKDLTALKKEWYNKLKETGFDDIEHSNGSLKQLHSSKFLSDHNGSASIEHTQHFNKYKAEYYRLATHFLNDHKFESKVEKFIWHLHSEGVSTRDIVSRLSDLGVKKTRWPVRVVVYNLRNTMFERYKNERLEEESEDA